MTDLADRVPGGQHHGADAPTRRPRRSRRWVAAVAVLAVAVAAGLATRRSSTVTGVTPAQVTATVKAAVDQAAKDAAAAPALSALVYQAILPSVVTIRTERAASADAPDDKSGGLGTGVVINAQGSILTARHVIAGATRITVRFADGTDAPAHLVS